MRRWDSGSGAASSACSLEITRDPLARVRLDLISDRAERRHRVLLEDGAEHVVTNPSDWPTGKKIAECTSDRQLDDPSRRAEYIGAIMELCPGAPGNLAPAWTT